MYFSTNQPLLLNLLNGIEDSQPLISYIFNGYLTLFCFITGTVLNVICIIIFVKFPKGSSTTIIQCYLVTLTIWQTALLISAFFLYCLPTLIYGRVISHGYYVITYSFSYFLSNLTYTGSIWLVLTLTVDRFLALCHPLTHPSIGKRSRVKRLMVIVSLSAIVFSLPRFFEVDTFYPCENNARSDENVSNSCEPTVVRTNLTKVTQNK